MPDSRVAITGLGVVTSAGVGIEPFWQSLLQADSTVGQIDLFDAGNYPATIAGQVRDFSARKFVPKNYRKAVKVMARDIELAVAAADQAFRNAGIKTKALEEGQEVDFSRLGCNIGAGLICCELDELAAAAATAMKNGDFDIRKWGQEGINNLTPLWLLKYLPNMLSCHVTIIHGAKGPSNCITCGDASAHLAVGEAAGYIHTRIVDAAIAGGAESKINPLGLARQALLKRLCENNNDNPSVACRPFDAQHDGTVLAEGGGMIILEDMNRAKKRNADIYAEVVGFGAACDPNGINLTTTNVGSLEHAIAAALDDAHIGPQDVDLIVTHGTGVREEDRLEADAWQQVFGQKIDDIPAMAVTGNIGSLFAGSGGVELAAVAMALHEQTVPPTCNFATPADGCKLNLSDKPRQGNIEYAVSGTFAIGGQSAAVVLKRCES